jgi:glucosylceramidase
MSGENQLNLHGFITAKDTEYRLSPIPDKIIRKNTASNPSVVVHVDPVKTYQVIQGFGGAFTESAATTFYKMPISVQNEIIRAYFDKNTGIGYTFGRTHINSCDFSLGNYAYTEVADDIGLKHFSIDHDHQSLIPLIKSSIDAAGGEIKLLASPWSPPPWMKTTGIMNNGGKLLAKYRKVWAEYYCRYILEYEKSGIDIWGISVQNEPAATQTWDSCIYSAEDERDFVRDYLGPAMHNAGYAGKKIIIWDHNRDIMFDRAKVVFDDPEAAKYVWGTGFHWYCGDHFDNVKKLHDAYPDKELIFTEGCQEGGPHLGSWDLGERYARSIINDLNRWTVAWIDWNIILDEQGGPNHQSNFCSAPIIADTKSGECHYQSSYYYLGHFSKFMTPGSVRIFSESSDDRLEVLAAKREDDKLVFTILNKSSEEINFRLALSDQSVTVSQPARSIVTLIQNL